ncbi:ribosome recycling factor [Longimicrobium terrae]|uniref:Ribosome-recycling factor n=1 Tax=Longimicrobium terrae TaxID=1639882 RepID=A0A841GSD5_9BACT|nr:ribosome recycling factor [Longimicrobium terrae]MBB4635775.1 ribosome recycling factor [Longimicrobium terrae]MBB6070170.1 ribosome recycling factor [Longimicrobium terrae]NNC33071.1 ribosome recycling factor [Longimicrobium terrae]
MSSLQKARQRMESAIEALRRDFQSVRTGKANPALLDSVRVEAYGNLMPLNQVGTVSAPEPRMLTIQPWDKTQIKAIEKALRESDLGLNPSNDGNLVRIPIPALTEDRRREFVKMLHKMAEEARVAVRQVRKDANDEVKARQKDDGLSEDDIRREQGDVQKLTDQYVAKVEEMVKAKEAEVMEV